MLRSAARSSSWEQRIRTASATALVRALVKGFSYDASAGVVRALVHFRRVRASMMTTAAPLFDDCDRRCARTERPSERRRDLAL